jgi:ABC-type transporter Mla subunit MlaD
MSLIPHPDSLVSQPVSADQLPKSQGDIREVIRRADAELRRQSRTEAVADLPAENLEGLVRRVASRSTQEIDRVIPELQRVRDTLRSEGERVSREIASYANLNQASSAMQAIGATFKRWDAGNIPSPAVEHSDLGE